MPSPVKVISRNNQNQSLFKLFNISDHKEILTSTNSICITTPIIAKTNEFTSCEYNKTEPNQKEADISPSVSYSEIPMKDNDEEIYSYDNSCTISNRNTEMFKKSVKTKQHESLKTPSTKKISFFSRDSLLERLSTAECSVIEPKKNSNKIISHLESLKEEPIDENFSSPIKKIVNSNIDSDIFNSLEKNKKKLYFQSPAVKFVIPKRAVYSSAYRANKDSGNKKTKASDEESDGEIRLIDDEYKNLKPKSEIKERLKQGNQHKQMKSFFVDNQISAKDIYGLNDETKDPLLIIKEKVGLINCNSLKALVSPNKLTVKTQQTPIKCFGR